MNWDIYAWAWLCVGAVGLVVSFAHAVTDTPGRRLDFTPRESFAFAVARMALWTPFYGHVLGWW